MCRHGICSSWIAWVLSRCQFVVIVPVESRNLCPRVTGLLQLGRTRNLVIRLGLTSPSNCHSTDTFPIVATSLPIPVTKDLLEGCIFKLQSRANFSDMMLYLVSEAAEAKTGMFPIYPRIPCSKFSVSACHLFALEDVDRWNWLDLDVDRYREAERRNLKVLEVLRSL